MPSDSPASRCRRRADQGDALLLGITHEMADVRLIARQHDAGRLDLKNARVRAVQVPGDVIKENLPLEETLQIILESAQIHAMHLSGRLRFSRSQ